MNDYRSNGSHHDSPLKSSASGSVGSAKKKGDKSDFLNSTFQVGNFMDSPILVR